MFTVIETPIFNRQWPDYWNEDAGDVIPGSGGCRKVRWGPRGIGKRSGVRIIHYNRLADGVIYLLLIYAKGIQDTIDPAVLKRIQETING